MSDHDKLTDEQLDELERLEKDVHEAWHVWDRGIGFEVHIGDACSQEAWQKWNDAKPKFYEKDMRGPEPQGQCVDVNDEFRECWPENRARLAVAARNALPVLIAELRALRKLRDEVEPVLRHFACGPTLNRYGARNEADDILARHYDKKEPTR